MDSNVSPKKLGIFQQRPSGTPLSTNQSLQVDCMYHEGKVITNFCRLPNCLTPLCPKCIPQHLQLHKQKGEHANVDTIDAMHQEVSKSVSDQLSKLQNSLQKLQNFKELKHDAHNTLHENIAAAKMKAQRVFDAFFDQLQQDLEHVTHQDKTSLDGELNQAERFIITKFQELKKVQEKLQSQKYMKYLVRLHGSHFLNENEQYVRECDDYIYELSKKTLDIHYDETKLYNLNVELARYVQIKNADFYAQNSQDLPHLNLYNNQDEMQNRIRTKMISPLSQNQGFKNDMQMGQQQMVQQSQHEFVYNQYPNNQLTININDYFEPLSENKVLHYFQEQSKSIHIYQLDNAINQKSKLQWKEIDLKITFTIPQKHTTTRSNQGDIYLIGGISNSQVLPFIWKLDITNRTLIQLSEQLNIPRHSATSIVLNNKLYILGGLNASNKQLNDVECLDLTQIQAKQGKMYMSNQKIIMVPPMQVGGYPLSVCTFKQQFLIKVSYHLTEIFDMNKWISINQVIISPDSGLVQVNSSSILVFGGGSYSLLKMNQNQQFVLQKLSDNQKISKYKIQNGPLIHQGKIFAEANQGGLNLIVVGKDNQWII